MFGIEQSSFPLVVDVNQLSFKRLQNTLLQAQKRLKYTERTVYFKVFRTAAVQVKMKRHLQPIHPCGTYRVTGFNLVASG